jgi:16S rRNA (uracil1498-N3)-methyltransferase
MRISRLFVPEMLAKGKKIELDQERAHYLRTVLRLKKEAAIILFNGQGGEYAGTVSEVNRKTVVIVIHQWSDRSVESPLRIHLGLSIARGDRMDFSVQKAVELGVSAITPLQSERCHAPGNQDRKPLRWLHWQKIIHHAAEQCGRTLMPELAEIEPLADWLPHQQGLKLLLDPFAATVMADLQPINNGVTLLIGPEGGFADHERQLAKAAGFVPVQLGPRILRTETATITAVSAVQLLWGDFCPKATNPCAP